MTTSHVTAGPDIGPTIMAEIKAKSAPGQHAQLTAFVDHYLHRIASEQLGQRAPEHWAAILLSHFQLARKRLSEQALVRVFNPETESDGWGSSRTVVQIVHADMPFLVDSVTMAIAEQAAEIQFLAHPIFSVQRDAGGYLMNVAGGKVDLAGTVGESMMYFEIDRISDSKAQHDLTERIEQYLTDVARAVGDWHAMRDALRASSEALRQGKTPYTDADIEETTEFLDWLGDDHFTLLGYRQYSFEQIDEQIKLCAVDNSGLGILCDTEGGAVSTVSPVRVTDPLKVNATGPLIITKTNARSTVHRVGYMDYIGVMIFNDAGELVGEHRFLGLYTSAAYNRRPWHIPHVRRKFEAIMATSGFAANSHGGKAMRHIMETLPRDELFQASLDELAELVSGIYDLQERKTTRLFVRPDQFGRFYSCLVYIPRDRFNTETRERVQAILRESLGGDRIDFNVQVDESVLARLHVIVRVQPNTVPKHDVVAIEHELVNAVRSWGDRLRDVLVDKHGEEQGVAWARDYSRAFPAAYIEDVSPWVAAFDVENLVQLANDDDLRLSLYRPRQRHVGLFRFKIFRIGSTIPLSDVLPMLENMGLRVVSERPYKLRMADGSRRWVQDFDIELTSGSDIALEEVRERFQDAFERVVHGDSESDGFNRLILGARLSWRQIVVIRCYCKYLLQTGLPFSQAYMERTLSAHPGIARLLVALFESRFDTELANDLTYRNADLSGALRYLFGADADGELIDLIAAIESTKSTSECASGVQQLLRYSIERVVSLDEDRILRAFVDVVLATLRTNAFQRDLQDNPRPYLSVKLESARIDELPKPRPWREIFVYSPRVEGVHLRGGAVARGGLRWSDRPEDFRTEVLGLMKAQMVKNVMIVPVGAKGGFVVKRMPDSKDREVIMAEVVACYRFFINGLLDITDNLREGEIVHPAQVVRQDPDDPYLVVAADKGTATFSDIANSVSQAHDFWMGDAFASGGSVGYDHKGMGITAKGGWESVKRHFRELGINCQKQDFTTIGIGDMAGDVFGNGMLLSKHIKLVGAFNHLHIFLDPNPDADKSWKERQRLFELPRSAWTDYDSKLISEGGGIFSRAEKTIPLSTQIRELLGTKAESLTPNELIRLMLKAPVDLLWNGGIGTYVKAVSETDNDVGDRANDALRINGKELKAKVVGEGGNLGLTQRGRIEYALNGGRINTDFIDNSAGVDCSDHEVNIKILLNDVMRAGKLDTEERNQLLADMTDEVSELVLRNNYLQTQALTMMQSWVHSRLGSKAHLIEVLENKGLLDREIEFLPNNEEIAERRARGTGLTRPELSVLLSYSKITLYQDLLDSDVPEDPYLSEELARYFPKPLSRFEQEMANHQLRREIIATAVTNSMVNRMGATFCLRMQEDTGASPADVAKAYTAAREVFSARRWWAAIEKADNKLSAERQTELNVMVWGLLRHATRHILNRHCDELDVAKLVKRYQAGVRELVKLIPTVAQPSHGRRLGMLQRQFERDGVETKLAGELLATPALRSALDIIHVATEAKMSVGDVAEIYFQIDRLLRVSWMLAEIEKLPVDGQWHAHARSGLRDELYRQHQLMAASVLGKTDPGSALGRAKAWLKHHARGYSQHEHMLGELKASGGIDYATASVAVRSLEQLVLSAS